MSDAFQRHGAFSWCELMTTDVDAAKEFYTQLLGWMTEDMPAEGMTYTVVKAGDAGVGGIIPMPHQAASRDLARGLLIRIGSAERYC